MSCCDARTSPTASCANHDTVVLKFGSSILPTELSLVQAVIEVRRHLEDGKCVVAVVSAFAGVTDSLLAKAAAFGRGIGRAPDASAVAALAATGEAVSVALLALALDRAGIETSSLDSGAIGLRTEGPADDARPIGLDVGAIERALADRSVLVVPGFVGRDELGRATLLGRGGSDLTALFIASKLRSQCTLLKDVDGIYDRDPAEQPEAARRFGEVSYASVLALPESIVQHKAVKFARDERQTFRIAAIEGDAGTLVHGGADRFAVDGAVEEVEGAVRG